jgi:vacuolar iron transporter family protein
MLSTESIEEITRSQKTEITEYYFYTALSNITRKEVEKVILKKIAREEQIHAKIWSTYTGKTFPPNKFLVIIYTVIARILGLTFAIKLMEKGEKRAQGNYEKLVKIIPEATHIKKQEEDHEKVLIGMIHEERLMYIGSMVLGINDALVELTGTIAGLTFTLQRTNLIAITGLITGIAASISMGGSEYLSTKSEKQDRDPIKSAVYTGGMYLVTVILLILPYFFTSNVFIALICLFIIAVIVIAFFSFYISITGDVSFKRRFLEMFIISLGVSILTFAIGYLVKIFFNIKI